MLGGSLITYVVLPLILIIYILRCITSPIAKLPGPVYNIFTAILLKYKEITHNRRLYVHSLHTKYGSIVRLGPNEVSFSSLEAVKEIYMSGGSGYDRTDLYRLFSQYDTLTMFSTPPKTEHSYMRRYMADRYANTNIMKPESLSGLEALAKTFVARCLVQTSSDDGFADVYVHLHCFALDGATRHLFHPHGTNSLTEEKDLLIMQENTYHDGIGNQYITYYAPYLVPLVRRWFRSQSTPLTYEYVLAASKASDSAAFTLVSKLQAHAKATPTMPRFGVPAECMDHLAAGIDTTGDGLCFLMYQLSLPSESSRRVQARLRDELVSNRDIPFDQLPYLDAVVKEGLRCFPPIPMSFPRQVPAGGKEVVEGVWLPGGTIVSCQPWTIHKNWAVFPDPEAFIPERWLEKEGAADRNRFFFTFSTGGRACIGKHLAVAEMKLLLREVYGQCRTVVSDQHTGDMEMEDQIIATRPRGQSCRLVFEQL